MCPFSPLAVSRTPEPSWRTFPSTPARDASVRNWAHARSHTGFAHLRMQLEDVYYVLQVSCPDEPPMACGSRKPSLVGSTPSGSDDSLTLCLPAHATSRCPHPPLLSLYGQG
eukprot:653026-Prorocentrum_minimum.AAC.7